MHESRDKRLIRTAYDNAASELGGTTEDDVLPPEYEAMFGQVETAFPRGSEALDLGCGDGRRFTQRLARHFAVTGVDFSEQQLAEARRRLPGATFICTDMVDFEAEAQKFAFIVCLYALYHLPLKEQRLMIYSISDWLAPGGFAMLLFNNTATGGIDTEETWCGGPMRWFHYSREDYAAMIADAGLEEVTRFAEDDAEPEAWCVGLYRSL